MNKLQSFANISGGVMKVIHRDKFNEAIKALSDGRYSITIEKVYSKRSNPQNAYLWGIMYKLVYEGLIDAGYEKTDINMDWVHDYCKKAFLKSDVVNKDGEVLEGVLSTSALTTVQFMQYISDIQKWASEYLGIYIPEPGEELEIKFDNPIDKVKRIV
jgi:hypothetical protein